MIARKLSAIDGDQQVLAGHRGRRRQRQSLRGERGQGSRDHQGLDYEEHGEIGGRYKRWSLFRAADLSPCRCYRWLPGRRCRER